MVLNVVENVDGQPRVSWPGAGVLFFALLVACALVPAGIFWLAFENVALVSTSLVLGSSLAVRLSMTLVRQQLQLPLDQLPIRSPTNSVETDGR